MKKSVHTLALACVLITLSCTHQSPTRKIASIDAPPQFEDGFLKASQKILSDIQKSDFNNEACVPYLTELEHSLDHVDVRRLPIEEIMKDAVKIADTSWKIRMALHKRLASFEKDCVEQIQSNFRQFRFIEDYLMERVTNVKDHVPSELDFQAQPVPMKEKTPYYVFRNNTDGLELKGGDILVSRGLSFLSAMIARLGKRGTQFSHIVFVHENEETKEIKTIESYVGVGVTFFDLDFALKNENARILWVRPKDKAMGARASKLIGEEVASRIAKNDPIKYDYALDFNDHSTMSCAEVAQSAYDMASNSKFHIPYYPNEVVGAKPLLEHIGLPSGETFEPGDMEIDPRFEVLGEFQDLRLTRDSRQKDVILSSLFQWMDDKDYILKDSTKSKMAGGLIYNVRRTFLWPLVKKALNISDFSKQVPRKMLRTVTLLGQIGEVMLAELKAKDAAFQKEHGWPMTYKELYGVLEEFRQKDLALFKNKKTKKESKFHAWFHPKKK